MDNQESNILAKTKVSIVHTLTQMGYRKPSRGNWVPKSNVSEVNEGEVGEDMKVEHSIPVSTPQASSCDPSPVTSPIGQSSTPAPTESTPTDLEAWQCSMEFRFSTIEFGLNFLNEEIHLMRDEQRSYREDASRSIKKVESPYPLFQLPSSA